MLDMCLVLLYNYSVDNVDYKAVCNSWQWLTW